MKKATAEEWILRFKKVHGDRYDYSKFEYINNRTKGIIICKIHGEFLQSAKTHEKGPKGVGCGCPNCGRIEQVKKQRKPLEKFLADAISLHNDRYDYSKFEYINDSTNGIIVCKIHGEFEQTPNNHLHGHGCKKCGRVISALKTKKSLEQFVMDAKSVHGSKYDYSKFEYINDSTKGIIICKIHGEFLQKTNNHLNGHGCSICKESKGESLITLFLKKYEIFYKREYKFVDCKNTLPLPFDFYLPNHNICIEFDGRQHYKAIDYFGGKNSLAKTQENDQIKTQYCLNNNIKLIRISYLEIKQINDILDLHLEYLKNEKTV